MKRVRIPPLEGLPFKKTRHENSIVMLFHTLAVLNENVFVH